MNKKILAIHDFLSSHAEELIAAANRDSGLPENHLRKELADALKALRLLPEHAEMTLRSQPLSLSEYDKEAEIVFIPKGRIGLVLPGTTPLLGTILLPTCARISGNTVFVKPSSNALGVTSLVQRAWQEIGIEGVEFLPERGVAAAERLAESTSFVFFMGSRSVGEKVRELCVKQGTEYLGEYEGNDWAVVFSGEVAEIAGCIAENVRFKGGKDCDSIKGVLAHEKVADELLSALQRLLPNIDVKCKPDLQDIRSPPFCSSLWFRSFSATDEVLRLYEENPCGLSAAVFDENLSAARRFARRLPVARVIINSHTLDIHPLLPWGGVRGTSRGGVEDWVLKFCDRKLVEWPS